MAGDLMDECVIKSANEIQLHQGSTRLEFQNGDMLGLLVRAEEVSDFGPLFMETSSNTGVNDSRRGLSEQVAHYSETTYLPLISLELCKF